MAQSNRQERKAAQTPESGAAPNGPPPPLPSLISPFIDHSVGFGMASHGMKACATAATAALNSAYAITGEMARFASDRLGKDLEAGRTVARCRTAEDAYHAQTAFLDEAVRDYAGEVAKLATMAAEATHGALEPLTTETEGVLHRVAEIPKDNGHFV